MKRSRLSNSKLLRRTVCAGLSIVLLGGVYVLSIVCRVSATEESLFGRSELVPNQFKKRGYVQPPTSDSFGAFTYQFVRAGQTVTVCKRLINSFQHAYGSALVAYEIGVDPADLLFRANEYAEATFSKERADGETMVGAPVAAP